MKLTYLLPLLAAQAMAQAQVQDVQSVLQATDKFRMTAENLQVDTQINVLNADGTPDKERRYTVFAQAKRQSLVVMQSPAEKGQKVLMLSDDFWLLMPGSQRPLRITPMQKLLGDASTGDIATMSWADDYAGKLVGEEPCEVAAKQTCLHLSLNATRKGVTYQRIELWVGKTRFEPVRADLYVLSDKLAKQATFVMDKPAAPTMVLEMVLADQVSNHKTTHVRYLSRKVRQVPPEWLNPMFLVRNPALD
ncbi:hypothetical protein MIZ03_3219 [Rhodoferax lithotrophicus]|uniref:Uncharacterized protein TP-0789 domain-containing protein n=1 Tax=Rhodoferax lithotrophicus TaxID=2798804 RepID=A0ABN6D8D0_9BURK|nr:outer membrane lipoprotein-sorting protein [Rhodoferax sp. MIZ03]BCO28319.1 hypothetical protein MIZ03_3219 [Rhodoferax sp. MIZ03]